MRVGGKSKCVCVCVCVCEREKSEVKKWFRAVVRFSHFVHLYMFVPLQLFTSAQYQEAALIASCAPQVSVYVLVLSMCMCCL